MEVHVRHDELSRFRAELPPPETILSIVNDLETVPSLNTGEWKNPLPDQRQAHDRAHYPKKSATSTPPSAPFIRCLPRGWSSPNGGIADSVFIAQPVPATSMSGERMYPPRLRTNLLLKAIDGRTTMKQLAGGLKMEMAEFAEDIRLLLDLKWISFNR